MILLNPEKLIWQHLKTTSTSLTMGLSLPRDKETDFKMNGSEFCSLVPKSSGLICSHLFSSISIFASLSNVNILHARLLWERENELSSEVEKLTSEVVKAEKNLDHATPGVSTSTLVTTFSLVKNVV